MQRDGRVDKALVVVVVALWWNKSTITILMNINEDATRPQLSRDHMVDQVLVYLRPLVALWLRIARRV
jgi:hypothetical protein